MNMRSVTCVGDTNFKYSDSSDSSVISILWLDDKPAAGLLQLAGFYMRCGQIVFALLVITMMLCGVTRVHVHIEHAKRYAWLMAPIATNIFPVARCAGYKPVVTPMLRSLSPCGNPTLQYFRSSPTLPGESKHYSNTQNKEDG